ncbi:hypothetical protein EsH8_V_000306 [Colletotrichum jinshuiense]
MMAYPQPPVASMYPANFINVGTTSPTLQIFGKLKHALRKSHGSTTEGKGKAVADTAMQDGPTKSLDDGSEKYDVASVYYSDCIGSNSSSSTQTAESDCTPTGGSSSTSVSFTANSVSVPSPLESSPNSLGAVSEGKPQPIPVELYPRGATSTYGLHITVSPVEQPSGTNSAYLQAGADHSRSFDIPSSHIYRYHKTNVWCGKPAQVPVPKNLRARWDEEGGVRDRLALDLQSVRHTMKKKGTNLPSREREFVSELRMSGYANGSPPRSVTLNPCIWILCGSSWCKKYIRKALKDLSWTVSFINRPIEVHVGGPVYAAAPSLIPLRQLQLDASSWSAPDLAGYKILYHVDFGPPFGTLKSASGLLCCATLLRDGIVIDQQVSRIGGFICTTLGRTAEMWPEPAITTAHGLLERLLQRLEDDIPPDSSDTGPASSGSALSSPASLSDTDLETDSAFESGSESDGSEIFNDEDENGTNLLGFRDPSTVARWTPVAFVGSSFMGNIMDPQNIRSMASNMADYALLELKQSYYENFSSGLVTKNPLSSYTTNAELLSGPVSLLFSDNVVTGATILPETQQMPSLGKSLPARKVQLSAPLAPGTSGTWLIRDESLCGMIIARYPGEPLALFVAAEDILQDIASSFPHHKWLPLIPGIPSVALESQLDYVPGGSRFKLPAASHFDIDNPQAGTNRRQVIEYDLPSSEIFDCDMNLVTLDESLGISSMSSIQTSIQSQSDSDGLQDGKDRISMEQQREIRRERFEQMRRILGISKGGVDSDEEFTPSDQKLGPTVMRKMSQDPGPPNPRAAILGSQALVSSKSPTPFGVSSQVDPFAQSRPPSTPGDYSISSADPGSSLAFFQHPSAVARYHMASIPGPIMSNLMAPSLQQIIVPCTAISSRYGAQQLAPLMSSASHDGQTNQRPDRLFKCDQCPRSFNRNHDLKRHKRIHLAVKPFPCNHCDKSFSRKDALKRHRLVKGCGSKKEDEQKDNNLSSSENEEELLNSSQGLDNPRPSGGKEELRNDFQGLNNPVQTSIVQQQPNYQERGPGEGAGGAPGTSRGPAQGIVSPLWR